ncbi:AEC family transporter [uncultured Muribaculum sp.]|jgi:auxin efflux transporter type protein|uniref:AEC family transporter n=2 Tax=uncultured Muribaculum sp. TaxID=1918613 RepID=UPI0025B23AC2|nr:AEC family transporter [uncultured Muribaculum sp.]
MLHIILYAIVPIVVVMLAGFISGKKGIFNGDDSKKFNKVVLDYALPAALFVSIVQADREMLARDLKLSIVSLVVIMVCFMAVYFIYRYCFKKNTGADAAVSALISGSPTIGFLGFAVLEPIFGTNPSVALVVAIVGIVVNAVGIPVGLSLLNASLDGTQAAAAGKKESAWKPVIHALEQPVAWAPILAVILVLLGLKWPDWASPSFDLIAKANASMAVFSAGITLSSVKIVINWQALLGSILKLIVMPALALIAGLLWHMDPLNIKMLVVACALPPAFSGIIIADEYNTYVATGTSSLTLSVILFIGFCPLWIWITDMALKAF